MIWSSTVNRYGTLPQMRAADQDAVQGRGLLLVDAVADRWGYDVMGSVSQPWGKRVWAELTVTP
ncbi:hypothetical protein [Streptomyces sp. NPDC001530]|uniref:hypothetical protein n=1 Tax=Streptomyces sp. NPDC001530 TaxID=3364582 RepID=UPI00369FC6B9